jgi:hypothetical protein
MTTSIPALPASAVVGQVLPAPENPSESVRPLTPREVRVADRYVAALLRLREKRRIPTWRELADEMTCWPKAKDPGEAARKWFERNPRAVERANVYFRQHTEDRWPQALDRAMDFACQGSIDHLTFFAKLRGEFKDDRPPGGAVINGNAIIVHVHE